jgi:hypothetical protein
MAPRILDVSRCPHCRGDLPRPPPRVCPACGGSLQKRFLAVGCLSSAPRVLLIVGLGALGALALRTARAVHGAARSDGARGAHAEAPVPCAPIERGVAKAPTRL